MKEVYKVLAFLFFFVLDYDKCSEMREDKLNWLEIVFYPKRKLNHFIHIL